jgi:glycosyltransferase involved in cell wall biosynthesis
LAAAHPEVRFRFCYRPHRYFRSWREQLPGNVRRSLLAESLGPRTADLFHGLNQRLPQFPLPVAVATFHDLFVLTGEYSTAEFRARFAEQARQAAAGSKAIITVSAFTKSQVVGLLGVDPARVHVVHHGSRNLVYPKGLAREKIILNVGAIQKRKNIGRLVEAFETVDSSWRLVLAGSAGFGSEEILARIAKSPACERIRVLGYVTPDELAGWYARASIFAFPSLDEGFGMPVLEAMTAGAAVLASNSSALPEVVGDAGILVDPEDLAGLAQGLRDLTEKQELREELAVRGLQRAGLFTWENAVRQTWAVYRKVLA